MKIIFALIVSLCFVKPEFALSQSASEMLNEYTQDKNFTGNDLYKWRNQMNFKPKYFNNVKEFDNLLLGMKWEACRQWYIMMYVTWRGYKSDKNNSDWFAFNNKLTEFYGSLPQEYIEKWYVPLFAFVELEKWAYNKSSGKGVGEKDNSNEKKLILPVKGPEKLVYSDEGDEYYIMTNTKKNRDDGLREIWLKMKPKKDKRELVIKGIIQNREKYGLATEGWTKYSFCIEKRLFDCNERKMKKVADVWYDNTGRVLDTFEDNDGAMIWENIVAGTEGPSLIKFACN